MYRRPPAALCREDGFSLLELTVALMLAELDCDSVDDFIDETEIAGNLMITNSGPVSSPFPGSENIPVVAGRGEL